MSNVIPSELIERKILVIRGQKVMLDRHLAELYGVKPIRLREQVKRNKSRFPEDFMFQLTNKETDLLLSQFAIPSRKHLGGFNPYVFTEQGVAMLSTVLHSDRAIQVNIEIMRAFVKLRDLLSTHKDFARKRLVDKEKKEQSFAMPKELKTLDNAEKFSPLSFRKESGQRNFPKWNAADIGSTLVPKCSALEKYYWLRVKYSVCLHLNAR